MRQLFTLGYSGLSLPPLWGWLEDRNALLVDVRMNPSTWIPEWRRCSLAKSLGPRYRWVRELGNVSYKKGGPIQLRDEAEGVRIVSEMLRVQSVVLLCCCRDHATCHRTTAAKAISEATGAEVRHLSPSDFTTMRQMDLLIPNYPVTL